MTKMMARPLACVATTSDNARPGVGAIRTKSRESRDPEKGRSVKF